MALNIEVVAAPPIVMSEFVELVEQSVHRGWPTLDVEVGGERSSKRALQFSIESTAAPGRVDDRGRLTSSLRDHHVKIRMRSEHLTAEREFDAMFPGSVFRREVRIAIQKLFEEYVAKSQVASTAARNAGVDRIEALLGQVARLLNSDSSLRKELQRANAEIEWLREEVERLSTALLHITAAKRPWPASWAARAVGALLLAAVTGGVGGVAQTVSARASNSPTGSIAKQLYDAADELDECEMP